MATDHTVGRRVAQIQRTAEKNRLLNECSAEAAPFLDAGDIGGAVATLRKYAPRVGWIITQERLDREAKIINGGME